MDFGRVSNIARVNFRFPEEDPTNGKTLPGAASALAHAYAGCPVWNSRGWAGSFYPKPAKAADYLKIYAQKMNAIELNTTHYRIPDANTVTRWKESTPEGFRFVPKIPQQISHDLELKNAEAPTRAFFESIAGLGDRLGPVFLQLAPSFGPGQLRHLEGWLERVPVGMRLAVEFRHPLWFQNHQLRPDARALLRRRGFGTVITDVAGRRDVLHRTITSNDVIVRFQGNIDPSDTNRVDDWANAFSRWLDQGVESVYFFVHAPDEIGCPELVNYFIGRLGVIHGATERLGLRPWQPAEPPPQQLALF